MKMCNLADLLRQHEDWLMERVLGYARAQDYMKYTSKLAEAWHLSIAGLSASLIAGLRHFDHVPEFGPDEDYRDDPVARFGVMEAERHRRRGVSLSMFLGLMKYYRRSYVDLLTERGDELHDPVGARLMLDRCFDRIEIGFCQAWDRPAEADRVAELQAANRLMVNEKNSYLTAFESLADPAFVLNRQMEIQNLNRAATLLIEPRNAFGTRYYDLPATEAGDLPAGSGLADSTGPLLIGSRITDLLPWLSDGLATLQHQPGLRKHVNVCIEIAGEERHFELNYAEMLDFSEKGTGAVLTLRNVTDRRRSEEDRRLFEQQIQRVQKLDSLGVLVGGLAHEFNNMLMAIQGNAEMAGTMLPAKSPVRSCIDQITQAAAHLADLTRQMHAFSGKKKPATQPVCLSALVQEMKTLMMISVPRTVTLDFDLAPDISPIAAEIDQLRQVIMNLLSNASEAIGDRPGTITIRTSTVDIDETCEAGRYVVETPPTGRYACLEVADDGQGMDEETRGRMFDPFFTTKFIGRGLGLAAVLGIVRGHDGAVSVDSEPGRGTVIRLLLPASASITTPKAPPLRSDSEQSSRKRRILIVDDEPCINGITAHILTLSGFDVIVADNGREALRLFLEDPDQFDAVLLDVTMPDLTGDEVLRQMRRIRPDIRAVLSSGYSEEDIMSGLPDRRHSAFIQKPYGREQLLRRVEQILSDDASPAG